MRHRATLQADLRASPRLELVATDASSSGAGACVAPVTKDLWRTLCNLAEQQGEHVRLGWGSSPLPLELTPSRCACARHSRRLVRTLRLPVRRTRSHQRARAHRVDVACEAPNKPRCAETKNLMLCRQPRRPRSSLKRPLLVKAPQFRTPAACIRVSQCVSVSRYVVVSILERPRRRAISRHLARLLETLVPQHGHTRLQFGSAAVARELKLPREPLPSATVQKSGACCQLEEESCWQAHARSNARLAPTTWFFTFVAPQLLSSTKCFNQCTLSLFPVPHAAVAQSFAPATVLVLLC